MGSFIMPSAMTGVRAIQKIFKRKKIANELVSERLTHVLHLIS